MPSIASSATDSTAARDRRMSASRQTKCALDQDVAAAVDGGRPRAPEAVRAAGRESGRGRPDDFHGAGLDEATTDGLVIYAKSVRDTAADTAAIHEHYRLISNSHALRISASTVGASRCGR